MLQSSHIKKASMAGVVSGTLLGLLLKVVELVSDIKVYTLLLNLDYVPLLNRIVFPEVVEFLIHLVISVVLCMAMLVFIRHKKYSPMKTLYFTVSVSFLVGILLYPTTALSERTPEITSVSALCFWLLGHALYGWVAGCFLRER